MLRRLCLAALSILQFSGCYTEGAVILYPSGIASVCSGAEVKLTCTITGRIVDWIITQRNETIVSRPLSATSGTSHFYVNNITFTFSIGSNLPLVYALSISPADNVLNGTEVSCRDREEDTLSSTVLTILNEDHFLSSQINIILLSERLERNGAIVTLGWTPKNPNYSYNVSVNPQVERNNITYYSENTRVQLNLSYNTFYNVNVAASSPCGQNVINSFIGLYYIHCGNPIDKTTINSDIQVIGYTDPAVEGTTVTISCSPGLILSGPHTSTCMENGEWEPDPKKVECIVLITDNKSSSLSQDVKIIIASVTVFVGSSTLFLIIGFLCHYFHPKQAKSGSVHATAPSPEKTDSEAPSSNTIQNVELEENIAYTPVRI